MGFSIILVSIIWFNTYPVIILKIPQIGDLETNSDKKTKTKSSGKNKIFTDKGDIHYYKSRKNTIQLDTSL